MKLVTYRKEGKEKTGLLQGEVIAPLPCRDMLELIERGEIPAPEGPEIPFSAVELLSPIPRPRQDVICLGVNYQDHREETGKAFTTGAPEPIFFSKHVAEAVAPEGIIPRHAGLVQELDYEAELAVVIGRPAANVAPEEAAQYIFGYTVLNDVTARDLQRRHGQWFFGKGLDGFTPMGPCIVTADEIAFPPALSIRTYVNGELRQDSNTSLLLTDIPHIIATLSAGITLLPGTIIATGTPAGVGMGFHPPRFLASGDIVACEIEGIGRLRNTVE